MANVFKVKVLEWAKLTPETCKVVLSQKKSDTSNKNIYYIFPDLEKIKDKDKKESVIEDLKLIADHKKPQGKCLLNFSYSTNYTQAEQKWYNWLVGYRGQFIEPGKIYESFGIEKK